MATKERVIDNVFTDKREINIGWKIILLLLYRVQNNLTICFLFFSEYPEDSHEESSYKFVVHPYLSC